MKTNIIIFMSPLRGLFCIRIHLSKIISSLRDFFLCVFTQSLELGNEGKKLNIRKSLPLYPPLPTIRDLRPGGIIRFSHRLWSLGMRENMEGFYTPRLSPHINICKRSEKLNLCSLQSSTIFSRLF